jgi:hypothetical protein
MKFAIATFFLGFCFSLQAQKVRVNLTFTFTEVYCGGAAPDENANLHALKKYAHKMIMVVREQNNKVDSVRTDSMGRISMKLRKGTYKFYESWRYYLNIPGNMDANDFDLRCLQQEWEKTIYKLVIARRKLNLVAMDPIRVYCSWNYPCLKESSPPPRRN